MKRKRKRVRRNRRSDRFTYGFNTWRASRKGVNASTVRRARRRTRRRGRAGRALILLASLLVISAAAVFLLRPMYVRTQQNKITFSLLESFHDGGQPVFVEPGALVREKEEQKGSPVYEEKEYAERETVGLVPVGILTLEQWGIVLPIVEGTDTVHLRYAIGYREEPEEGGMLTLYGRRLERGDRLFSKLYTLLPGSGLTLVTEAGEARYVVTTNEIIEKEKLEERLVDIKSLGETDLLLVTTDRNEEGKLLLVHAMQGEKSESLHQEEPDTTTAPTATTSPTPTPEPTQTPKPTASPTPSPTPKPTRRPVRRTPTPEPTAEPTPTPDNTGGFGGIFGTPAVTTPMPESPVPEIPETSSTPEKPESTGTAPATPQPIEGDFGGFGGE